MLVFENSTNDVVRGSDELTSASLMLQLKEPLGEAMRPVWRVGLAGAEGVPKAPSELRRHRSAVSASLPHPCTLSAGGVACAAIFFGRPVGWLEGGKVGLTRLAARLSGAHDLEPRSTKPNIEDGRGPEDSLVAAEGCRILSRAGAPSSRARSPQQARGGRRKCLTSD